MSSTAQVMGLYELVRVAGNAFWTSALGPSSAQSPTGFSHHGRVGLELSVVDGRAAASAAAGVVLDALENHFGSLDAIECLCSVRGYIAAAPDFTDHARVLDAASEALVARLGDRGSHARAAIGVATLPFDLPVVIEVEGRTRGRSK